MRRERNALALRIAESQETIERSKELLRRLDQVLAAYGRLPDAVIADSHGLVVLKHVDDVPPTVAVTAPLGGSFFPGVPISVAWTAGDNAALGGFDLAASFDGGATYPPIAGCTALPATARSCSWTPTGSPTRIHSSACW